MIVDIVQIREAKAGFSALVTAAENGRPIRVSRHRRPCAMIGPLAEGARLYPLEMPNLANDLLALPGLLETERDAMPSRAIAFA